MGLLAPWFLAGVLAVGLPVYLHLLRKHKTTPVPFASLMFFERRTQSSIQHRRLQHILLLALRTALLILLMLAFAKPFLRSSSPAAHGNDRLIAICIDDSFSMRQGDRLARAKHAAEQLIESLGSGDRAQVIASGGAGSRVLTGITGDRATLRSAVESVQAGDGASAFGEISRALNALRKSANQPVAGQLFSDMQKTSVPATFSDLKLEPGVTLELHPAADRDVPNFAVESVQAPRRIYDPKRVHIVAAIHNYGAPAAQKRASLVLNGRAVAEKSVEVPAGGRVSVEFTSLEAPYGLNRGEIRLAGSDAFPEDDHFYFPLEREDPRPALFVHDPADARSLLYFQNALDAAGSSPFRLESLTTDQAQSRDLGRYAFVVLSDTGRVPVQFESALEQFVRSGGAVLTVLGSRSTAGAQVPAAGVTITSGRYAAPERDRFLSATVDSTHPSIGPDVSWSRIQFYQTVQLQPSKARVAARLSDGTPLLLDLPVGEGRVLILTSALDNVANDLPLQPVYVPFVQRMSNYLGGISPESATYTAGSSLDLRSSRQSAAPAEVLGPDGKRALSLADTTKAQSLQLTSEGFYDVRRANGKHELVAVNPDRRESDLTMASAETLALWKGGPSTPSGGGTGRPDEPGRIGLWWYVLAVALLLGIAESVLGNNYLAAPRAVIKPAEQARRNVA